ncbi:hypothetical protein PGC34_19985 [Pseudomonas kribbensis]|uniref:hypothetical protein n=1 Tax=Pseudomonas kribbensis TaxID=1628086 RepID=UPI003BF80E45
MNSSLQQIQARACRKFALEQNERMVRQAHALNAQAHDLISNAQPNIDTFEQYHRLRQRAEEKFQEAAEHLRLVNEDFVDVGTPHHRPRPYSVAKTLPKPELLAGR